MKERLIGACILVALAVIFIPMLFNDTSSGTTTVSRKIALPTPATTAAPVQTYRMSLTHETRPEPISPLEAAGKLPTNRTANTHFNVAEYARRKVADLPVKTPTAPVTKPSPQQATPAETSKTTNKASKAPSKSAALPGWFVQAGSFSHHSNAKQLTQSLKHKGFSAFVMSAVSHGETVYRVRIGPFESRDSAETFEPKVADATGNPAAVVSNP